MITERVTVSGKAPVDAQLVMQHARLIDGDILEAVQMAIVAGREIEDYAQIALITQTVRITLPDGWPDSKTILLPIGPVLDGAVATVTADGAAVSDVTLYSGRKPQIKLTTDLTDALQEAEIVIEYEAGFGADASSVPADLAHAIADHTATLYDMRGECANGMSPHAARIAARYRRVRA